MLAAKESSDRLITIGNRYRTKTIDYEKPRAVLMAAKITFWGTFPPQPTHYIRPLHTLELVECSGMYDVIC